MCIVSLESLSLPLTCIFIPISVCTCVLFLPQPAWLQSAASDPNYKPRIERLFISIYVQCIILQAIIARQFISRIVYIYSRVFTLLLTH